MESVPEITILDPKAMVKGGLEIILKFLHADNHFPCL